MFKYHSFPSVGRFWGTLPSWVRRWVHTQFIPRVDLQEGSPSWETWAFLGIPPGRRLSHHCWGGPTTNQTLQSIKHTCLVHRVKSSECLQTTSVAIWKRTDWEVGNVAKFVDGWTIPWCSPDFLVAFPWLGTGLQPGTGWTKNIRSIGEVHKESDHRWQIF